MIQAARSSEKHCSVQILKSPYYCILFVIFLKRRKRTPQRKRLGLRILPVSQTIFYTARKALYYAAFRSVMRFVAKCSCSFARHGAVRILLNLPVGHRGIVIRMTVLASQRGTSRFKPYPKYEDHCPSCHRAKWSLPVGGSHCKHSVWISKRCLPWENPNPCQSV